MSSLKRIRSTLEHLAHVEHPDPIQALRGRLLSVLLMGTVAVALVLALMSVVFNLGREWDADVLSMLALSIAYLFLAAGLLAANKAGHTRPAVLVFLAVLAVFTFFGDVPQQVVEGRSTFLLALPIILASILVCPSASFVFAALISLGTYAMSRYYALEPVLAPTTVMGLFLMALVGWLAASSLNEALLGEAWQTEELRRINKELDQRVEERTAELAVANERLKELDRMKTEFLSTAAHELRAPLTVIVGFSELLARRPAPGNADRQRHIEMIYQNATRLSTIVADLLDLSRIEAGREIDVNLQWLDLYPLVEEMVAVYQAHSATHSYHIETGGQWPAVTGDPDKLRQVMNNLLSNATKYSPNGGKITIQAQSVGDYLQVSVQDDGIGITHGQQAHLFEPFYRADASNTAISGTGLGLVICKRIVERHGGRIWVDSQAGGGAAVHFTVPLAGQAPLETETSTPHDLTDRE